MPDIASHDAVGDGLMDGRMAHNEDDESSSSSGEDSNELEEEDEA